MRVVVQRTNNSKVTVDGKIIGEIDFGLTVLLGVSKEDNSADLEYIARKLVGLRIFEDMNKKMNLSIKDVQGKILLIPQFTLYGDVKKGTRPGFDRAAGFELANQMYEDLILKLKNEGLDVETGQFQADMIVSLNNLGPVTILIDSKKEF